MGTRNVTIIKMNGKPVMSKYCQWDGGPDWAGQSLHKFIKEELNLRTLKSRIKKSYVLSEEKAEELWNDYEEKRAKVAKAMDEAGLQWEKCYYKTLSAIQRKLIPSLTRDTHGGEFLTALQESNGLPLAYNSDHNSNMEYATGKDQYSFSCEYCYELDLDKKTLAVYEGHYKGKPHSTFTFKQLKKEDVETFMPNLDKIMNPHRYDETA
jgi:hypothetical protein